MKHRSLGLTEAPSGTTMAKNRRALADAPGTVKVLGMELGTPTAVLPPRVMLASCWLPAGLHTHTGSSAAPAVQAIATRMLDCFAPVVMLASCWLPAGLHMHTAGSAAPQASYEDAEVRDGAGGLPGLTESRASNKVMLRGKV